MRNLMAHSSKPPSTMYKALILINVVVSSVMIDIALNPYPLENHQSCQRMLVIDLRGLILREL